MKHLPFHSLYLLPLCLFYVMSCDDVAEKKIFPQEYRLTGMRYPLGGGDVKDMEIKDGFLILCMNYSPIRIFSTEDYSFIQSFEERQPSEPSKINQFVKTSSPFLYIMNVNNKNEIRKYQVDSLGQPVLLQSGFTGVTNSMHRAYMLHDSLILYDEFIPDASLKIHNLHTNSTEHVLPYGTTSLEDRFLDKNMGGVYANDSCIAFVYKYQDRIDFFDWQFNLKQSVNHQKSDPVIYKHEWGAGLPPQNVLYYGNSFMGQNYFYTLYRGVSNQLFRSDSILVNRDFNIYVYGLTRDVLEVYDLQGHPLCRFHFDDLAPSMFVVDEDKNRLLGHRIAYGDSLLVYPLQGLPKNGGMHPKSAQLPYRSSLPTIPEPESPQAYLSNYAIFNPFDVAPTYFVYMDGIGIYFPTVEAYPHKQR